MHLRNAILALAFILSASAFPFRAGALTGGEPDRALAGASVMVLKANGGVCSGVVIARDIVLTAAHCATGAEQYRIHYRGIDGQPVLLEPAAKAVHPSYVANAVRARRLSVDLALFRLKEPLPAFFNAAPLAARQPHEGATITIGGYGFSKPGDPRSAGIFHAAQLTVREPHGAGKVLIWMRGGRVQVCTGDSGGPLLADGSVFAVTAWADINRTTRCSPDGQGVLLGPQRHWIDATLAGWGSKANWRD